MKRILKLLESYRKVTNIYPVIQPTIGRIKRNTQNIHSSISCGSPKMKMTQKTINSIKNKSIGNHSKVTQMLELGDKSIYVVFISIFKDEKEGMFIMNKWRISVKK